MVAWAHDPVVLSPGSSAVSRHVAYAPSPLSFRWMPLDGFQSEQQAEEEAEAELTAEHVTAAAVEEALAQQVKEGDGAHGTMEALNPGAPLDAITAASENVRSNTVHKLLVPPLLSLCDGLAPLTMLGAPPDTSFLGSP